MNNDIQNLVNELNSTTPKTQMYMIQLCRSAINNLYDLTDTIEENISSLQNSVVANTSAISGLQGSIDVINTNLSAYLSRIEALEDKTTHMSKLENGTKFSNNVNVDGIITTGDDIISGGVVKGHSLMTENDNGVGSFHIDDDGDMSLYLPPNAGKLITTGNISEYASGSHLYQHNLVLRQSGGNNVNFMFQPIYKTNNNAIDFAELATYLYNNGNIDRNSAYYANKPYYNSPFLMYSADGTTIVLLVYLSTSEVRTQTITIVSDTITQIF